MAAHLTRSDGRILRRAVYPMQWMRRTICCGMAVKKMGMLRVSVREMKAWPVNMESVTLNCRGR